jgi:hypothetical protein
MNKKTLFGSGAAVGALVGLLIGMSVSPVVATVVSALVGLVTAYCTATLGGGIQEALKASATEPRRPELNAHIYLAGFSVIAFVTVLAGTYIRTHNLLGLSPRALVGQWEEAGFTSSEAHLLVAKSAAQATNNSISVLIADDVKECDELLGYIDQGQWPLAESFFQHHGKWKGEWERLSGTEEQRHSDMERYARSVCAKRGAP